MKLPVFTSLPTLAMVAVLMPASPLSAQALAPPWLGTWQLDPQTSSPQDGNSPYKRVVLRIEGRDPGLAVSYDMVGTRGGTTHMEWTGAFDSVDYPVQGVDYVLTNAYTIVNDHAYEIVVKVDGELAATTRVTVSADRRTLTALTTSDTGGDTVTTTSLYQRRP